MINAKIVSKQEIVLEFKLKAKSDLGTHCRKMLLIMEDESVDRDCCRLLQWNRPQLLMNGFSEFNFFVSQIKCLSD